MESEDSEEGPQAGRQLITFWATSGSLTTPPGLRVKSPWAAVGLGSSEAEGARPFGKLRVSIRSMCLAVVFCHTSWSLPSIGWKDPSNTFV